MKKLLLLTILAIMFFGCNGEKMHYLRSYISVYEDAPMILSYGDDIKKEKTYFYLGFSTSGNVGKRYYAPEISSEYNDKFLEIAERNGDRTYNRYEIFHSIYNRHCSAYNFKAMEIVCLNTAWDNTHAAGVSLNDLVTINYGSHADYVRSGYVKQSSGLGGITKRLTDLAETDLAMITPGIYFYFDNFPSIARTYELEVTMTTTEGEEKTATCTFDFE